MTYSDAFNIRTTSVKFNDVADAIDGTLTRTYVSTTTGTSTAYAASPSPAWQNYSDAPVLIVTPHVTNTAGSPSVTMNVSGLGAKVIKRGGVDISAAALVQGVPSMLVFNATGDYFEVLILENALRQDGTNAMLGNLNLGGYRGINSAAATARTDLAQVAQIQDGDYIWLGTTGGTATAQTATATPAITAYKAGQKFRMLAGTASTGTNVTAHSLNINGLGAKSIKTSQGSIDPTIGDWTSGALLELVYDGTTFRIDNAAGAWASWSPTLNVAGGGTSGITFSVAIYQKYSRICHVQCVATWTQTVAPAAYIDISLPINPFYNSQSLTVTGFVGANIASGIGFTAGTAVRIYNYNNSSFSVGANQVFFGGTYMTA